MTMLDLPLFANCPYSKKDLETGLESAKYREDFWTAFTNSPQPPLPAGFIRRKDDTLIYKDPKPYEWEYHATLNTFVLLQSSRDSATEFTQETSRSYH